MNGSYHLKNDIIKKKENNSVAYMKRDCDRM